MKSVLHRIRPLWNKSRNTRFLMIRRGSCRFHRQKKIELVMFLVSSDQTIRGRICCWLSDSIQCMTVMVVWVEKKKYEDAEDLFCRTRQLGSDDVGNLNISPKNFRQFGHMQLCTAKAVRWFRHVFALSITRSFGVGIWKANGEGHSSPTRHSSR